MKEMPKTSVSMGYEWFTHLSGSEKGTLGETMANVFLIRELRENRDEIFDDREIVKVRSPHYDVRFHANPVDEDGRHRHHTYQVDLVFPLSEAEYSRDNPKIIVEVKTGEYAELERSQRVVMERLANNSKYLVLKCDVEIGECGFTLEFSHFTPWTHSNWSKVSFLE